MEEVAAEEPDAAALVAAIERPEESELAPGLEPIWDAFWDLHADRARIVLPVPLPTGGFRLSEKAGALPFTAIDRWAARHGYEGEEFDLLHTLLKRMDDEWLLIQGERIQDKMG